MSKPSKQIISRAELLKKIQDLLNCPECRNIHIDNQDIQLYRTQVDGANWKVLNCSLSGGDQDLVECRDTIDPEIQKLRAVYDVATNES